METGLYWNYKCLSSELSNSDNPSANENATTTAAAMEPGLKMENDEDQKMPFAQLTTPALTSGKQFRVHSVLQQ